MQLRKNIFPKSIGDAFVTTFMFVIVPLIYYFELFVVLPKFYQKWSLTYVFHFVTGSFILFNICSNLVAVMLCDTSIKGRILPTKGGPNWRFCTVCESVAPPRSWHCGTCNVCILKRDHHCMFTSCCVGHHNHRYFVMFVLYIFIATVYASYYNVYFIYDHVSFTSWLSVVKIVFPLATLFLEWTQSQFYVFYTLVVLLGGAFSGVLLFYHTDLILKGAVTHERNEKLCLYDCGRMENVKLVLGENWGKVWISPFVKSDLPHDGIEWNVRQSTKGK